MAVTMAPTNACGQKSIPAPTEDPSLRNAVKMCELIATLGCAVYVERLLLTLPLISDRKEGR